MSELAADCEVRHRPRALIGSNLRLQQDCDVQLRQLATIHPNERQARNGIFAAIRRQNEMMEPRDPLQLVNEDTT